jgi:hypothetical protein
MDIPNLDVYVNGYKLDKESDALEKLTTKIGVTPLLAFFSTSPEEFTSLVGDHDETVGNLGSKAPREQWFSAGDGLKAVRNLIEALGRKESHSGLVSHLKEFETVLETVRVKSVRWHLAIDY